jgi:hypothetical protein
VLRLIVGCPSVLRAGVLDEIGHIDGVRVGHVKVLAEADDLCVELGDVSPEAHNLIVVPFLHVEDGIFQLHYNLILLG